jgi:hypothetical protein
MSGQMRALGGAVVAAAGLAGLLTGALADAQARAGSSGPPSLKRAIGYYNNGDDVRATKELSALLAANPSAAEAAKAHMYMGLVRLNALDSARARAEFLTGLTIDPALELPFEAPPKAGVLFRQAQASLNSELTAPPPAPAASPPVAPPAAPQVAPQSAPEVSPLSPQQAPALEAEPAPAVTFYHDETPKDGPSHLISLTVGGVGLATAVAGGVCFALSVATLSSAQGGAGTFAHDDEDEAATSANEKYASEWLFSIGGGLVGAGVVIFVVEQVRGASPEQAASSAARTLTEGIRF